MSVASMEVVKSVVTLILFVRICMGNVTDMCVCYLK